MMRKIDNRYSDDVIEALARGDIGVLMTDTLYGVVASANNERAVEKVYEARGRDRNKPCIVLIDSLDQIWDFEISDQHSELIERYWPGKVSIVLPAGKSTPEYIHRGGQTVAFRMPEDKELRALLRRSGPLVAPSANTAGNPPAVNIEQAEKYFGDVVDFYVDSGECTNLTPSKLIEIDKSGSVKVLR